jgi:pyrroloquinoline-quinone synthase
MQLLTPTHKTLTNPQLVWEDVAHIPTFSGAINRVAEVFDFCRHPYILWMQASSTNRESFRRSQLPFRYAVECFSQPLSAVLARIVFLEQRLPIFQNVAEEHGNGITSRSHKFTFIEYLQALGANYDELDAPCSIPVLAFNQSILNYCLSQPPEVGAAMLGIIEHLYVEISGTIAKTIERRHWVLPGSQSHYASHEKLDTEHARDLLVLAAPVWDELRSRRQVSQALVLGAHYFWSLYNGLLPSI